MKIIHGGTVLSERGRDGKIESASGRLAGDFTDHDPVRDNIPVELRLDRTLPFPASTTSPPPSPP